ncbi:CD209 antigen-like protein C [Megalobrama amblycephala]|uniref:CD209 antigen-like protein C n=1 Tax=Megalobrama amblycephala TaxID=75352 RepID=UPI002013D772|nr:CD209 antigen-like protein C [Megalobrama amblycephala]XP_048051454.1 CD209 antigen-like protein C [Megalobrama amblycephala]
MNRANPVHCSSTSVATHNQEFTARIPKSRINQTESQESGSPNFYKVVIVCLALFFGILLAGLIALTFKYRTDTVHLKTDYDQCIDDQDYLNRRYYNLTIERDQLQANEKVQTKKVQTLEQLLLIGCFTGYSNFSSHLYCASAVMLTWNESRHSCAERGAYLVIINSSEEQEFVSNFEMNVWIGLSEYAEGVWKWVDNTELIQGYWITGEPNHLMDEDCVEIQPDWSSQGNWNDFPCEEKKHYICEYEYEMLNF